MEEMDAVYDLPYVRTWHPSYDKLGGVAALEEVQFSLVSCRGCFGSCSFCAIHAHQGRIIQARSHESILREAKLLIKLPGFKGYIHDVGGPTANFRHPAFAKQLEGTPKILFKLSLPQTGRFNDYFKIEKTKMKELNGDRYSASTNRLAWCFLRIVMILTALRMRERWPDHGFHLLHKEE